jgi:hypothetical protein
LFSCKLRAVFLDINTTKRHKLPIAGDVPTGNEFDVFNIYVRGAIQY